MVTIIPERRKPSFGEKLNLGLGRGAEFAGQLGVDMIKNQQRQQAINEAISGGKRTPQQKAPAYEEMSKQFLEKLPDVEQALGRDLNTQDVDQLWSMFSEMQPQQQLQRGESEQDEFGTAKRLAAIGEHDLSKVYTEEAKKKFSKKEKEIEHGYTESKPTRERGRELTEDLPYKDNALLAMRDAVETQNLGMFSLDNLAEMTGIEGLRSPEGAAFKTASKEFFLGNLSRVGSRGLNQMMERVVLEMAPLIGRKTEANLAVMEILGAENDVSRKEAELIHDIGQRYKEKHGTYPEDLAHRVSKELRPYATQRQKDALAEVDRIKQLYEPKNKQGLLMYDPSGNLRRVPHGNKKEALKEGYRMP